MEHTINKNGIYNDINNLSDVLHLYKVYLVSTHGELKGETNFAQTLTAIRRYTLPGMGHPAPAGGRPTKKEEEAADEFLKTIDLSQLNQLMECQERGFELMKAGKSQQQAYKSRLKGLLIWAKTQSWFPKPAKAGRKPNYCPQIFHGFGAVEDKRSTNRKKLPSYSLFAITTEETQQAKEILKNSDPTQEQKDFVAEIVMRRKIDEEISKLLDYWFDETYPGRLEKALKITRKKSLEGNIRQLLGWNYGVVKKQLIKDLIEKEKAANRKNQEDLGGWGGQDLLDWFHKSDEDEFDKAAFLANLGPEVLRQIHLEALKQTHLEALVPHPDAEGITPETAEMHVDTMICNALKFKKGERNCKSPHSSHHVIDTFEKIVRFHWHKKAKERLYRNVAVMNAIRKHQQTNFEKKEAHKNKFVADIDLKWLELPEVLQKVVNPLRLECAYRLDRRKLRNIVTIAKAFQVFIMYGCLTFTPPRRQEEWRNAKLANACRLSDKPKDLKPGEFIHPLPPDREEESEKYFPYIHREADGKWYLHNTPDSYKTGKTYGEQDIEILNPQFADGKCFYDYIEAFIYGYYRDRDGNWHSGGEWVEAPNGSWQSFSLRMTFEPKCEYPSGSWQSFCQEKKSESEPECAHFFVRPGTGIPYIEPPEFTQPINTAANRLTGQLLTPHLLRDIYATWFLDQGYTPERISSLAYAMGHSEEMLRKIYDRRRPKQKRRPIEEAMQEVLTEYVT